MLAAKKNYHLPPGYSLLETALRSPQFMRSPLSFISNNMEKFGDTYSAVLSPKHSLILTQDPLFVNYILKDNHTNYHKSALSADRAAVFFGNGLLFSNGDEWLRQRRLIQPGFHQKKIQGLYEIMIHAIDQFITGFPVGKNVDVYPLMHQLAFTIVINSLFDIKVPVAAMDELSAMFTSLQDFLMKETNQPFRKILYPFNGNDKKAIVKAKKIRDFIRDIVRQRVAEKKEYNDLLDMLLNSRYEDTGQAIEEEQLIDEILVLIFAGHETTANTLSWILYLISSDAPTMEQLTGIANSISVYESCTNETIAAVIYESMRLYPAAWMTDRVALQDDHFGGFSYPRGTIMIPFFFGVHRHRQHWEAPASFIPGRFIDENGKLKNTGPFSLLAPAPACV